MHSLLSLTLTGSLLFVPTALARPLPLSKRIAQVIVDATQPWVQACTAAGGGDQCNPISVTAFSTLLAAPGPCEQQNAADAMIDLAKKLNNDPKMIQLAQVFAQQPRNSPNSLSVLYCQQPPKNEELNGLFQCQFQGDNPTVFTSNVQIGAPGTIPLGHSSPLSPAGSCLAHPQGPIADGSQLVDITQDPGVGAPSSSPQAASSSPSASSAASSTNPSASTSITTSSAALPSSSSSSSSSSSGGDFHLQNGLDAQKLNQQFASLSTSSPCSDGQSACVKGAFAQCIDGVFVMSPCGAGLSCFALPLVNKPGTSLTCDTQVDAEARIAATGATGGLTGNSSGSGSTPINSNASSDMSSSASEATSNQPVNSPNMMPATTDDMSSPSNDFHFQNGVDAQELNRQFSSMTENSSCSDGAEACIKGSFAQCVGGRFVLSPCAASTQCFALPLVNKAGTSLTCDTQADAEARIAATGVAGGLQGE